MNKTIKELKAELVKEMASIPKFKIALAESTPEGRVLLKIAVLVERVAAQFEEFDLENVENERSDHGEY